ncbi:MAG: polysaccharide pyruvyl transferase CsaB [Cyanobacteria bacterium]|nr:polysaccharide pyruvyl transferase CsaB [Cyanobacteriota bacterium]
MRVVLCGYYGMGNGGDEALLATLLQMLPAHVTPVVLSGNPTETSRRYGVETCPRKSFGAVLTALRQADAFIWGGGSLMQDATSALNPIYYGGLMAIAQLLGLKTIAWAQGIGPLNRAWTRWLTRKLLRGCTGVSVRDQASAKLLATWGIAATQAPDPVWALTGETVADLWQIPAPRVVVALRAHPWLTEARLAQITEALVTLQQKSQVAIALVPFQPSHDLPIAEAIQPHLPGPSQILTVSDPRQLKGIFQGAELAIAMRLHALIMAAAEGCRCFALSYDPKVAHLMADQAMAGWEMDPKAMAHPPVTRDLRPWPITAVAMVEQWLARYEQAPSAQGEAAAQIALDHQTLLTQVLSEHR